MAHSIIITRLGASEANVVRVIGPFPDARSAGAWGKAVCGGLAAGYYWDICEMSAELSEEMVIGGARRRLVDDYRWGMVGDSAVRDREIEQSEKSFDAFLAAVALAAERARGYDQRLSDPEPGTSLVEVILMRRPELTLREAEALATKVEASDLIAAIPVEFTSGPLSRSAIEKLRHALKSAIDEQTARGTIPARLAPVIKVRSRNGAVDVLWRLDTRKTQPDIEICERHGIEFMRQSNGIWAWRTKAEAGQEEFGWFSSGALTQAAAARQCRQHCGFDE